MIINRPINNDTTDLLDLSSTLASAIKGQPNHNVLSEIKKKSSVNLLRYSHMADFADLYEQLLL